MHYRNIAAYFTPYLLLLCPASLSSLSPLLSPLYSFSLSSQSVSFHLSLFYLTILEILYSLSLPCLFSSLPSFPFSLLARISLLSPVCYLSSHSIFLLFLSFLLSSPSSVSSLVSVYLPSQILFFVLLPLLSHSLSHISIFSAVFTLLFSLLADHTSLLFRLLAIFSRCLPSSLSPLLLFYISICLLSSPILSSLPSSASLPYLLSISLLLIPPLSIGVQRAASPWRTLGIRSCRHFVQTWPDSECSHTVQFLDSAVLRL